MKIIYILASFMLAFMAVPLYGQGLLPYILNGSATQTSCNCYVLTPDANTTSGTAWNKNKINLNQSFNYVFDVYLGCKDANGADGIGFILQTKGTNLGATGQGLGFKGISPSLGVLIDTYQNNDENDPAYDHIAIQMNGMSDHLSSGNLAGPVTALVNSDNIEDCQWHLFRINWDATAKHMEVSVDNQVRLTLDKDIVNDIFGGDPEVFWGFAGSTGGSSNLQQFCAALRPDFGFNPRQIYCDGIPIQFLDKSSSFGDITRWWWDFGDGTQTTAPQPAPHTYPGAGNYTVKLVIEDNSGCISDTLKAPFTIGSYPEVDFGPTPFCLGTNQAMENKTRIEVGAAQQWLWEWGDGTTSTGSDPAPPYTIPGPRSIQLTVTSDRGCSGSAVRNILFSSTPDVTGAGIDACLGTPNAFRGTNQTSNIHLSAWKWDFGDGGSSLGQTASHVYADTGVYHASLYGISTEGCLSPVVDVPVRVTSVHARAGKDTIIAAGQPLQLQAGWLNDRVTYQWSPATGLNDPFSDHPVAVLQRDQTYRLTLISPEGCTDTDDVTVKVYKGPEFYVPNAFTPNGDGKNDVFRVIAPGVPKLDFFCIWNRWGQEIYRSNDLPGGWDGKIQGQPAPADTYVWMVQGVDYTGRKFSRKGFVTLIR
ncbi:gliding motility-associated-like protein [Chitinophaga terrae (ex Kim and Jung 2007)]|uniref:lectin-like domain-containing protein n=1 Tax=Chitinophaga terrae (ex Kim and Jung 2007) TaxID=408074 RepID=UPI00277D7BB3|nr:PKD domain-containing protein [Chitinophaga terrae (ex Kim and Jung 2007)]MDQ0108374.1 gliding motility-associated-like protein [Chitinophaga terrae (ex Kim and Jung 2007)]